MDDNILELLLPFLKEIVTDNVIDVRRILTKDIKERVIYRHLEEGKILPSI
jgi:AAA15 family ATPase/GTPase